MDEATRIWLQATLTMHQAVLETLFALEHARYPDPLSALAENHQKMKDRMRYGLGVPPGEEQNPDLLAVQTQTIALLDAFVPRVRTTLEQGIAAGQFPIPR